MISRGTAKAEAEEYNASDPKEVLDRQMEITAMYALMNQFGWWDFIVDDSQLDDATGILKRGGWDEYQVIGCQSDHSVRLRVFF